MRHFSCQKISELFRLVLSLPTVLAFLLLSAISAGICRAAGPLNGEAVFQADDGLHGFELYFTDGTTGGTFKLPLSDKPRAFVGAYGLSGAVAIATEGRSGRHYVNFVNSAGVVGPNLNPPANDTSTFRAIDDKLYWRSHSPITSLQFLRWSDGTTTKWVPVDDGSILNIFKFNGVIYVDSFDGGVTHVWKLLDDKLVKAFDYGDAFSPCCYFSETQLGSQLLFGGGSATRGTELWITDNTVAGRHMIKDIQFGTASGLIGTNLEKGLATLGNRALFVATDLVHGPRLWVTDGTAPGTAPLPISFGSEDIAREVYSSIKVKNGIGYFVMRGPLFGDFQFGATLLETDGTAAGTKPISLLANGRQIRLLNIASDYAIAGGWLYFSAMNYKSAACPNFIGQGCVVSLYRLNATTRVAELVKTMNKTFSSFMEAAPGGAGNLTAVRNSVIFTATDVWTDLGGGNAEPWASDGSGAGTVKLKEIAHGVLTSSAGGYVPLVGP